MINKIDSLGELDHLIKKGCEFEAKNQEYWEDYTPAFGTIADVCKMIRENRLRVKEVELVHAIIMHMPSLENTPSVLESCDTLANLMNNFKTANFQTHTKWSRLIERDTGKLLSYYDQDTEDTK